MFSTPTLGTELKILNEKDASARLGEAFLVGPSLGFSSELLNCDHNEVYYRGTPRITDGRALRRHGDYVNGCRANTTGFLAERTIR